MVLTVKFLVMLCTQASRRTEEVRGQFLTSFFPSFSLFLRILCVSCDVQSITVQEVQQGVPEHHDQGASVFSSLLLSCWAMTSITHDSWDGDGVGAEGPRDGGGECQWLIASLFYFFD